VGGGAEGQADTLLSREPDPKTPRSRPEPKALSHPGSPLATLYILGCQGTFL